MQRSARSRPHSRPTLPPRPRPHRLVRPPRKTLDTDDDDDQYLPYTLGRALGQRQRPRLGTAPSPSHATLLAQRGEQDNWLSNPNLSIVTR